MKKNVASEIKRLQGNITYIQKEIKDTKNRINLSNADLIKNPNSALGIYLPGMKARLTRYEASLIRQQKLLDELLVNKKTGRKTAQIKRLKHTPKATTKRKATTKPKATTKSKATVKPKPKVTTTPNTKQLSFF